MNRRSLLKLAAAMPVAPLTMHLVPAAEAQTTGEITQVVGVQNLRVGDWVVTALLDGMIPLSPDSFSNLSAEEAADFLTAAFHEGPEVPTGVNAYVLRNGSETILVDAGGAGAFPGLGGLANALDSAGILSTDVTKVLLTHMHPDHIGGLLGQDGVVFSNATLHVHAAELGFWTSAEIRAQVPEGVQPFFDLAVAVIDTYGDKVVPFDADGEVMPGLAARHLPGHTPGHTGFAVSSEGEELLIWGDLVAVAAFQFPKPDASIGFDVDAGAAIETRKALFADVAANRTLVAGMHLAFPGVGHVVPDGDAYRFVAKDWAFTI